MEFHFSELNKAVRYTLKFYEIERIQDYLLTDFNSENRKTNIKTANNWHEIVLDLHGMMSKEIAQNAFLYNDTGKAYFFGLLKEWLGDYRIESVNIPLISNRIEQFNSTAYEDFLIKTEEKEKEFKNTDDYKQYKHLEMVERKTSFTYTTSKLLGLTDPYISIPQQYHRFICVYSPQFLDTALVEQYVLLANELLVSFRNTIKFHLEKYERVVGLIPPDSQLQLPPTKELAQLILPEQTKGKLKVNISVPQLAYLFNMLNELNPAIFDVKTKTELYKFVTDNFVTKATKETGISLDSFKVDFYKPANKTIEYWIEKLKKMLEESRKKIS